MGDLTLRAGAAAMLLAVARLPRRRRPLSRACSTRRRDAGQRTARRRRLHARGHRLRPASIIPPSTPRRRWRSEDVRVGDEALADGVALTEGGADHRALACARRGAPPTGRPATSSFIDVSAASGALRALPPYRDRQGRWYPAGSCARPRSGALLATATLSVHRVRERTFAAPGIDAGEVRFDLSIDGGRVTRQLRRRGSREPADRRTGRGGIPRPGLPRSLERRTLARRSSSSARVILLRCGARGAALRRSARGVAHLAGARR